MPSNLPPGVTDSMIEDQSEWDPVFEAITDTELTPKEALARWKMATDPALDELLNAVTNVLTDTPMLLATADGNLQNAYITRDAFDGSGPFYFTVNGVTQRPASMKDLATMLSVLADSGGFVKVR